MYEETALHINRMKKKEDIAMKLETYWRKQDQILDLWPNYDIITGVIITVMTS